MDRLQPLDALFVEAEDEDKNTSMAIASIAVFEGPAPSHEEVLALVADRLPLVPRYHQKLRAVPSVSGGRSGSTTRPLTSAITFAAPLCRNPAETSNSPT